MFLELPEKEFLVEEVLKEEALVEVEKLKESEDKIFR